jgi:hypothetical protein
MIVSCGGQSHLGDSVSSESHKEWLRLLLSDIIDYYYIQEDDMPKKKKINKDVCESCGKPKVTEEMTHFKAVQEAMKYIRIKDNNFDLEELPL